MKVRVIYNPVAGSKWQSSRLKDLEDTLTEAGIPFETHVTAQSGDATRLAEEARLAGDTHVLVFGGDGTLREAAQALAGSDVILVPLPSGTANLLGHELKLTPVVSDVPKLFSKGVVKRIDLGKVEAAGQNAEMRVSYFALMAGIGIDAMAVRGVDSRLKRWIGWVLYLWSGLWHSIRHKPFRLTIHFSDLAMPPLRTMAWVVVIGNAKAYGMRGVRVASHARMDDGLLDICVFQSQNLWQFIDHFFKVLMGRHLQDQRVLYFQARSFRIETNRKIPVQLDGDFFGETPVSISVVPGVLRILLPPPDSGAGPDPVIPEPLRTSWAG